jgi:hypothetical protein
LRTNDVVFHRRLSAGKRGEIASLCNKKCSASFDLQNRTKFVQTSIFRSKFRSILLQLGSAYYPGYPTNDPSNSATRWQHHRCFNFFWKGG